MMMLIESVHVPKISFVQRFLMRLRRDFGITVTPEIILGLKFMKMTIPIAENSDEKWLEELREQAVMLMGEFRINTVCIKEDFPYKQWFESYRRPRGDELIKRLVGRIASKAAESNESVCVFARRFDRDGRAAVSDLCERFRYVMLVGQERELMQIADSLSQKCGASIIVNPIQSRASCADVAVFFDAPQERFELDTHCIAIAPDSSYYGNIVCSRRMEKIEFAFRDGVKLDIPDGFSEKTLIYEAIFRGRLRFQDFSIKSLEITP